MERACKNCRFITKEKVCPACGSDDLTEKWRGVILVVDPEKSEVAKALDFKFKGKYASKLK